MTGAILLLCSCGYGLREAICICQSHCLWALTEMIYLAEEGEE